MTYIGDEDRAAPQLHRAGSVDPEDLLEQCVRAIELMLYRDVIHGDLSPYNVLVWGGRITVIDFPQAVDPKKNRHAESLLGRDVRRICDHFARSGVFRDADTLSAQLWTAWTFADLVPEELRGLEVDPTG
jgi:RIO kinase 1